MKKINPMSVVSIPEEVKKKYGLFRHLAVGNESICCISAHAAFVYNFNDCTWNSSVISEDGSARWQKIVYCNDMYIAVGAHTHHFVTSKDGLKWDKHELDIITNSDITINIISGKAVITADEISYFIWFDKDNNLCYTKHDVRFEWRHVGGHHKFINMNWECDISGDIGLPEELKHATEIAYRYNEFVLISSIGHSATVINMNGEVIEKIRLLPGDIDTLDVGIACDRSICVLCETSSDHDQMIVIVER